MIKVGKSLLSLTLTAVFIFGTVIPVSALTSGTWNVQYAAPSNPNAESNPTSYVTVDYFSGGYVGNCKSISGANGRGLTITSSSAGGMNPIIVTTTGKTKSWRMKSSTTGLVKFAVTANTGYACYSTGTISILN